MAHHFTAKRERAKYVEELRSRRRDQFRDKLEKLMVLVIAYRERLSAEGLHTCLVGAAMASGSAAPDLVEAEGLPEFDQALAIQLLYFPAMEGAFEALRQGVIVFRSALEAENANINLDPRAWAAGPGRTVGARIGGALTAYQQAEGVLARMA